MVLLSEIVQTFILADFCYYYVKRYVIKLLLSLWQRVKHPITIDFLWCSVVGGQLVLRLPSGVV